MITKELLRKLRAEADLGAPHRPAPDLNGKVVLVIGASHPSGFGYNFGRVAAAEGGARVVLTVSRESRAKVLGRYASAFGAEIRLCDVTRANAYGELKREIYERHGRLDAVVVAPAYLNPKYFAPPMPWEEIPEGDKQECRRITVSPLREVLEAFEDLLAACGGVAYGVSFPLKQLPGYAIGPAKEELERLAVDVLAPRYREKGVRVNILSLGPFDSISASVIPDYEQIARLAREAGCRSLTLGEMVREALATVVLPDTGRIYHIDGGLYEALGTTDVAELLSGRR